MKQHFYLLFLFCAAPALFTLTKAQALLDPKTQPQFVNPLPSLPVIDGRKGGQFTIAVTQFQQDLGLKDPVTKTPMLTTVWGYGGSYPGPTILAKQNRPLSVRWENKLVGSSGPLPHLLPVDTSLDWALSGRSDWRTLGVPLVTHLHGAHTEVASDGLPLAWFTPNFALKGEGFEKETYLYNNDQRAATLWYHDHAMGITRLNVYAGLGGFYLLTDEHEQKLKKENKLPPDAYEVGLAIQDRTFTANGQLFYPFIESEPELPDTSTLPEIFGDFILVNGKVWPVLEVEPRMYRFRILNASDSRFYVLSLSVGQKFIQIGSDGGLLPKSVQIAEMLMGPGERRDVLVDFAPYRGATIILENGARTPFPDGDDVDPQTTGRVMAFKVTKQLSGRDRTKVPKVLSRDIRPMNTNLPPRELILFESKDQYGRIQPQLGTFEEGIKLFSDPVTETPGLNTTETWEIYNETVDAHPIHLHLVQMQLLNRQRFEAQIDEITGKPTNVRLLGKPRMPDATEAGLKDTYVAYPGEVTRVIAHFDIAGMYVWHCHILSHEDHEMMRPFLVQDKNYITLTKKTSPVTNATAKEEKRLSLQVAPVPFSNQLTIRLWLQKEATVLINIYNSNGERMQQVYSGRRDAGMQSFVVDGSAWSNGTYFCEVIVDDRRLMRKLVLQR